MGSSSQRLVKFGPSLEPEPDLSSAGSCEVRGAVDPVVVSEVDDWRLTGGSGLRRGVWQPMGIVTKPIPSTKVATIRPTIGGWYEVVGAAAMDKVRALARSPEKAAVLYFLAINRARPGVGPEARRFRPGWDRVALSLAVALAAARRAFQVAGRQPIAYGAVGGRRVRAAGDVPLVVDRVELRLVAGYEQQA